MLTKAELDELVALRFAQQNANDDLRDGIKTAAERHQLNKAALRRYVCAIADDSLAKLLKELEAIARLEHESEVRARAQNTQLTLEPVDTSHEPEHDYREPWLETDDLPRREPNSP